MQIFLDVDGVLLDFESSFVCFLKQDRQLDLPEGYRARDWDFADILPPAEMDSIWKAFISSEQCAQLSPLVDPEYFNEQTKGCLVHLVTNFPLSQMHHRWANLHALGFCYHGLHYCGLRSHDKAIAQPKSVIIKRLQKPGLATMFVDDYSENCLDVFKNCPGVEVWLMKHPFNKKFNHQSIQCTNGWSTLFRRMRQIRRT